MGDSAVPARSVCHRTDATLATRPNCLEGRATNAITPNVRGDQSMALQALRLTMMFLLLWAIMAGLLAELPWLFA